MEGNRKRPFFGSEDESPSLKYRRLEEMADQGTSSELESAAGSSASLPAEIIMPAVSTTSSDSEDVSIFFSLVLHC